MNEKELIWIYYSTASAKKWPISRRICKACTIGEDGYFYIKKGKLSIRLDTLLKDGSFQH